MHFNHSFVTPPALKQITNDGKREYLAPSGKKYESVTSYLDRTMSKKALEAWKKRVGVVEAAKISKAASARGTELHALMESYVMNKPIDCSANPLIKARFAKIQEKLDKNLNNIRLIERPLYSDVLELAGTPDIIGDYTKLLSVLDFKTSTKVKKKKWIVGYFLQAACYGVMFHEHFGEMPKQAVIVMSTEALNQAQVFVEPMDNCIAMLQNYRQDPLLFQKRMEMYSS